MLAYTSQKRGSEKAAARAKAGSTGLSPNWWLNDWNNQANAPLLRSQANTYAAPTSPFATEAFAQAADPLAMFRPKPGEPATKRLARTPGMLENVMARIDSDPRLRLSPQDRDLALSSFWLRQRLPDGAVPNAMTPGGMRGPISEADVEDVLSKLRDPQKRAALEMQVEGIRRERYRMQLPFTADDLRDATAKGLTFVRGRDGMIELSDALAMWNRAGMAPVEARDIGDEGRAIMQAQTVAPLVMGSFGTTGDAGFGRFKEMARQEASKQSRRKWSWPFEVLGAVVNEAIRPGHMAEVAAVSRKQLESKLGRPLTTREERVLAEDIRWGQEQMGQFVSALATSGHSESAQVLDDVVNFFPQVGDAAEVWADPKSSESERQWALLEAGLAIGIGTQLGREGLGKALRAPGKLYIDQPGILGKGVPKAGEDAWDAYLNSYKTHQESEGLFRPAARERATGGDVGARPRWDVKPDPNYDPGEPVDLVGIAKSRDPEMLRRRKMLAELIVDPDDPRLDPFDDRFDEAFRDGVAASLGVEPNEVVRAVEDRQRSLYEENFVREIERSEMPDADLSGSETKYFIPWYLNKKTQTWMPIKSRPRKFLSYRGVDAAMMGGALSRIIEIAEWMDDGTTVYSTSAADFIGRSKTARNKGVYARSGSTNTPEGAMRISEIITHDGGGIGNLNDLDTDNSRVWVPAEAVRIYQKEVRERLKELSRDVEELAAAEMGFTYDEYRAARDHYNEELERLRSEEDSGSGFDAEEGYETAADDAGAVDRDPEPGVAARAEGGQEEVARHEVTDRASFETALRQQRGLGEGQADAILAVTDARAKGWARETGGQIDDWYASRIRAVTSEAPVGFPDAGRSNSGAVSFQNDGSAVIHAFETADVTTFAHEVGHIFERDLPDHEVALLRQIRKKAAGDAWGEADREWFADSFTEYLRTGKTAHEGLKSVFERFKAWMAEIYRSIRNRPDVKVSDDLRGLFDRMLDEEGFGQPGELRDRVIGADGQKATAAPRRVQIDGEWLQLDPAAEKTYDRLEADYRAEKRRLQAVVDQERDLGRREIAEIDLRQLEQEWQVQRRRFASEVVNRELDRQHVYGSADEGDGEDVLFQKADKDRPWYVLRSEQAVEKLMKGPMPAGSLRAMLLNAGVKADELKWTGLDELMEGGGKVTPDEVRARLAEGRVRLEEVRFGGDKDAAAIADWQRRYNEVEEAYRNASGEKANPILYKNLGEAVRNDIGKLIDVVDREGVELSLEGTSAVLKVEETWSTRKRVIQRKIPDVQWNWIRKMAPAEQKVALANLLQSDWEFNVDRIVRDMEASDVSGKDIPVYVRMQGEVKQAWEAIAEKAKKVEDLRQARSDLQMVQFERNQDPRYNAYRASKGATETYEIEEYSEDPELEYHIFNSEGEYITTAFDKDYAMEELDRLDSEAGEGHYISEEYGDPQIRYDIVNEYGDSMEAHWSREEAEAALEKYQEGRDNYREFLIQWPEGPGINQPHWGRAHVNTLMHVRTSDLPIDWALGGEYNPFLPKGDQALVIEEIQSDWHQKGRDAGYRGPVKVVDVEQVDRNDPYLVGRFQHVDENTAVVKAKVEFGGRLVDGYYTVHKDWVDQPRMMESLIAEQFMRTNNYYEAAPQAPFEKTWHEVGLKRAIRMAAEEGYGEMLWPAGKEHAALYNQVLADNLDQVVVQESTRTGLIEVMGMKGGAPVTRKEVTESELPGMIGGKMAKEAMEQIRAGKRAEFSGDNLTIGGKGMEGFYDQMLPAAAKKLVRKFGSDVERVTIGEKDFWRVPVTDEMRASVMDEGLVLFQKKPIRDPLNRPVGEKPDWKRAAADVARTVKHSTEKAAAALGNPLDKLRNAGREGSVARMAGQQLATDTERVLNLSSAHTLKLLDAIDQTVKKELGPLYRQLPSKRAALNAVAEKAVRGEWGRFTDQEKRIWGAWVDVNRALIDEAQARGVMVDRVVDRFVPPQLRGERIWFFDRTGETPRETEGVVTGIVTDGRGNSVAIDVRMPGGEIRRLNQWERFSSRQLVAPERFFPRQLKDDVYDLLQSGPIDGQTGQDAERYERLMEAVQRSVGAKDRAEAERIRAEIFDPRREIKAVTGGVARLERPRIPFELDPEFYNTDFYEVVSGHVGAAVKRLTMAKVWGQDGWRFAELAGKLGNETDELAGEVKVALGDRGMLSESTRMIRTLARLEGAWQALSKLTGIGTAIVQIGQTAAPAGLFGSKAYLQGWGKYLEGVLDKVKGQVGEIDRVRLSGAIENSVLELSTVNGPADVAQKLADIGLTVTGVKPVDTFFRYHAAMVGRIAAEDAVRRLKVVNGKVVRDAQFRLLNDWMLLDEAAVNRLAETRTLTDDDLVMAYQAGSKTQIRNRTADLPAAVSRNPLMSVMMRFQQFNYGQVKILGWAAKEAAKGNVAPLARMTVAYAAAGWVTTQLKNKVLAWIERKEERPVPEGLLNELIFYTTKGGMYGMFSRLYEGQVEPDMADASSAQRSSRFAQDVQRSLVPPIVSDAAINPMAAKAYADKTGGGLKDFLDEWARRSIVVYGRASRRNEPDYWYIDRMRREMRDELNAQGYKPGDVQWYLDALYPVPAPRGATEEYRTYRENYETLVKMGYTPAQARKELGPAPDKFAGDRGAEPEDVPEPDREIEDRIQKDLAAAAQRGGR